MECLVSAILFRGMTTRRPENQLQVLLANLSALKESLERGGFWSTHPAWDDRIKNIEK
jgi:Zn-dependent protease with chaperone function